MIALFSKLDETVSPPFEALNELLYRFDDALCGFLLNLAVCSTLRLGQIFPPHYKDPTLIFTDDCSTQVNISKRLRLWLSSKPLHQQNVTPRQRC